MSFLHMMVRENRGVKSSQPLTDPVETALAEVLAAFPDASPRYVIDRIYSKRKKNQCSRASQLVCDEFSCKGYKKDPRRRSSVKSTMETTVVTQVAQCATTVHHHCHSHGHNKGGGERRSHSNSPDSTKAHIIDASRIDSGTSASGGAAAAAAVTRGVESVDGGSTRVSSSAPNATNGKSTRVMSAAELRYRVWCMYRLRTDFPRVPADDLENCLNVNNNLIGPTYKALWRILGNKPQGMLTSIEVSTPNVAKGASKKQSGSGSTNKAARVHSHQDGEEGQMPYGTIKLLSAPDPPKWPPSFMCPQFANDWEGVAHDLNLKKNGDDAFEMARLEMLQHQAYEEDLIGFVSEEVKHEKIAVKRPAVKEEIECGCCYTEQPFNKMVQCAEGHLFCYSCLQRRVEESTFGNLAAAGALSCMDTGGCNSTFPASEVRRALTPQVLAKYEQRQGEDSVARAQLQGLVRCPFCEFPVDLDPDEKVLHCPNSECGKASCRTCREPDHRPLKCEQVEKKGETNLRVKVEEMMTKAVLRTCTSCGIELVKNDGCNKITCRCGHHMCYVCREPIQDYEHFCRHPRDPGKKCTQCKKCSLWTQENVEEVAKKAREEALQEAVRQDPNITKRPIAWAGEESNRRPSKHRRSEGGHA